MEIYSGDADGLFFDSPYNAKRLLDDSVKRTRKGFKAIGEGSALKGCGNILLGRIESVGAFSFVALSGALLSVLGITATAVLIPATVLNLTSRIPGISSFGSVQNFTRSSNTVIYRILRVNVIAIPVFLIFLSASAINIIPGILKSKNILFRSIHWLVEPLGPLNTKLVKVGDKEIIGTKWPDRSMLSATEEYFRALSSENYLTIEHASNVKHYHTSIRS